MSKTARGDPAPALAQWVDRDHARPGAAGARGGGWTTLPLPGQVGGGDEAGRLALDDADDFDDFGEDPAEELAEASNDDKDKHDEELFKELCEHIVGEEIPVEKIVRIGKKSEIASEETDGFENGTEANVIKRPRPLKVCFHSNFEKRKFYASLNKLKEAPLKLKSLSVQYDLICK